MTTVKHNWLREAIGDEQGLADMAYISIGALCLGALVTLAYVCTLSGFDYVHCNPITTVAKGDQSVTSVIPCRFDPLPIGQAAGLIFGAFAALIGALAGYMAATKRQPSNSRVTVGPADTVNVQQGSGPTPAAIVPVPFVPVPAAPALAIAPKKPRRKKRKL